MHSTQLQGVDGDPPIERSRLAGIVEDRDRSICPFEETIFAKRKEAFAGLRKIDGKERLALSVADQDGELRRAPIFWQRMERERVDALLFEAQLPLGPVRRVHAIKSARPAERSAIGPLISYIAPILCRAVEA